MKSGYKSTEAAGVAGYLGLLATLILNAPSLNPWVVVAAVLGGAVAVVGYARERRLVKTTTSALQALLLLMLPAVALTSCATFFAGGDFDDPVMATVVDPASGAPLSVPVMDPDGTYRTKGEQAADELELNAAAGAALLRAKYPGVVPPAPAG